MALKNLFDMAKADRYTADGREEIIKAQEAETEDKVYQIGEISQKTGLQKTANGWKPPKETKFGKVKQNKEGQWGVQTKQGKGSDFLKHKSEKEASRALANYTRGYNTTERSKQDPHSDEARQQKQWNKETEKIRKNNNAERRAEHAENAKKGNEARQEKIEQLRNRAFNKTQLEGLSKGKLDKLYEQEFKTESKPAPRREAVSAGRMQKDLDGNFWSRPEDFKEDITSRGWDVDEMTNEYAVISNEAGSQYEVRFDDHSDDGDLTVKRFKALQIDEDDDDDSLEDKAPRVLTGDTRIRVRKA